ncbi:hypothetical protein [Rubrimonas cliftonensis]|uniref:Uncharacterized protein n=1 Tax=Rubrimonas cliftonensis TaxID=89524 RepID=A0A1H4GEI8_9RHOB|nr:hypothetical protein [Rubrimonas cliftonensis]SEB08016.1 hypothetical protein SAMN05444370_1603 [Rubrimonas cliftonensis]
MKSPSTLLASALFSATIAASASIAEEPILDRTIVIASNELKVLRPVDKTPYPDTLEKYPDLMAGGGYRLEPPNEDGEWYARVYQWSPGVVYAYQGERVRLEFFGINGDLHPTEIPGYGLKFDVARGEITRVDFTADKAGLFDIVTPGRAPSMTAQLVVLPRP